MPPPQSGGGGGQGQQDNSTALLWIFIAIFVAAGAIWFFLSEYIIIAYLKIKSGEIFLLSLFTNKLQVVQQWIAVMSPAQIKFADLQNVATVVGSYYKIPVAAILIILAALIYKRDATRAYKKTYTMRRFLELEKVNWPQINPVAKMDLTEVPLDEGPWAMSIQPMAFAKKHNLLEEEILPLQEGQLAKEQKITAKLKKGEANKFFSLQLGQLWRGADKLPIHVKALFVIFVARIEGDTEIANNLLLQIAKSSGGKLDFSGVDALISKYKSKKIVKKVEKWHAYILTVMATLLALARASGVLASAEFLWLKPVDRRLWYMLNNVGRRTAFTEVAGPYAHWLAEQELGRKITAPMVEEAAKALEAAVDEIIYKSDRDLEAERLGIE